MLVVGRSEGMADGDCGQCAELWIGWQMLAVLVQKCSGSQISVAEGGSSWVEGSEKENNQLSNLFYDTRFV